MEIISRHEAMEKGLTRYFTGKPCKNGHICERIVSCWLCIECNRNNVRKQSIKSPDRVKHNKRLSEKKHQEAKKQRRRETTGHYDISDIIRKALANNTIIKTACQSCGCLDVEAHHADYSRPLDVVWLCRRCHTKLHNEVRYGLR